MANKYYDITKRLSIPELASPRYADLTRTESENGGRVIGGDLGDIEFFGYTLDRDNEETVLYGPRLVTSIKSRLTKNEAYEIANLILMSSYYSIGVDTVERS